MSIPVSLEALEKTLPEYDFAYLLTASAQGGPHAVAVTATLVDGTLDVGQVGNRTRAGVAGNAAVTVLFPPPERGGY